MRGLYTFILDRLEANYWLIPAIMGVGAALLALLTVTLDRTFQDTLAEQNLLILANSVDGARALLSTIAGSMVTVAGTVFSLTMVVLSLSSQQHGPLTLENFLRDRVNQVTMGIFTATFIFCLLVLSSTPDSDDERIVPLISGMVALALAVGSLAMLIYFIHHIAASIRAVSIIGRIGERLLDEIDRYPQQGDGQRKDYQYHLTGARVVSLPEAYRVEAAQRPILCHKAGYVQVVNDDLLLYTAKEYDTILELTVEPGDYVLPGTAIGTIYAHRKPDDSILAEIASTMSIGRQRTQANDIRYIIDQLVSVAVRALSPGVNDPNTATQCVNVLSHALLQLSDRHLSTMQRHDDQGKLRLVTPGLSFTGIVSQMFDQIRRYGKGDIRVMEHLLRSLNTVVGALPDGDRADVLRRYIDLVRADADDFITSDWDRQSLQDATLQRRVVLD